MSAPVVSSISSRNKSIGHSTTSKYNRRTDNDPKHTRPFSKSNKSHTNAGTGRWNNTQPYAFKFSDKKETNSKGSSDTIHILLIARPTI